VLIMVRVPVDQGLSVEVSVQHQEGVIPLMMGDMPSSEPDRQGDHDEGKDRTKH